MAAAHLEREPKRVSKRTFREKENSKRTFFGAGRETMLASFYGRRSKKQTTKQSEKNERHSSIVRLSAHSGVIHPRRCSSVFVLRNALAIFFYLKNFPILRLFSSRSSTAWSQLLRRRKSQKKITKKKTKKNSANSNDAGGARRWPVERAKKNKNTKQTKSATKMANARRNPHGNRVLFFTYIFIFLSIIFLKMPSTALSSLFIRFSLLFSHRLIFLLLSRIVKVAIPFL